MKCPKCQFENPESAKFCNECGNELELVCPGCGKQNPVGSKFCNVCGQKLEEVLEAEEKVPEAEGERKHVTVLFSDLSGFTAMSEKLDPEEVKEIMSRIFGEIAQVVTRYEGFLEKFVGDAVMALFGVPKAHEDDPVRAVRAAREIHDLVQAISPKLEEKVGQPLAMHTGINTGLVVTGEVNMEKGVHGVVGDTINLASRLTGLAKPGEILVSPGTRELITPYFETEALEAVTMKGKAQPMIPYRVVGVLTAHTRFEAAEQRGLIAFTGREQELAALHSCLDKAMARSGQFVTVVGEAGVGKSRLLYELRHSPNRDKITVLEGRCESYGSNTPYFPFLNALRRGLHLREEDTPAELLEKAVSNVLAIDQTLERYIPLYLHLLSIPSEDYPLPKHLQGEELKSAFEDALAALNTLNSQGQPMVLILEDWHWADEASDSALKHLVGVIAPYSLMVVVVYRPEYASNWGSWSHHTPIILKSLDTQHSENIIKSVWGAARLPKGLTPLIHERTGGNPLFIEEICNALAEEGAVHLNDSQAMLTRPLEHLTLPDTVQAVIRARLDRLDRYARETLGLASVIGREFARRILERISASRDRLSQSLEALKVLELIQQIRVVPEAAYMFKQVLTQEVTYETLLHQQRRKLHGLVGRATEEVYADRIEEQYELLAHHYGLAEGWEKAVHFGRLAAEKAYKLSQFQQAITLYEQTKEWLLKLPENKIRQERLVDIWLEMCQSNIGLGQFEKAVEVGLQAETAAKVLGDRARLGMTYLGMSIGYLYQGNFKKTEHYALQANQYLEGTGEEQALGVAEALLGVCYIGQGLWRKSEPHISKAVRAYERLDKKTEYVVGWNVYTTGCAQLGYNLGVIGRIAEAKELFEKGYAPEQEEVSNLTTKMAYCSWQGLFISLIGEDHFEAAARMDQMVEVAERSDSFFMILVFSVAKANVLLGMEDFGAALSSSQKALKAIEGQTIRTGHVVNLYYDLVLAELESGDQESAKRYYKEGRTLAETSPHWWGPRFDFLQGLLLMAEASPDYMRAEECFQKSIQGDEEVGAVIPPNQTRFYLAQVLAQKGEVELSRSLLTELRSQFRSWGISAWQQKCEQELETLDSPK